MIPAVVGAAATLLGAGVGAAGASSAATEASRATDRANDLAYRMFNEQHNWEEGMSSTAYQRAVKDMRAAGLNPAVMMQGAGGPASTPGSGIPGVHSAASEAASSGLEAARMKKDVIEQIGRVRLNKALIEKAEQETDTSAAQARRFDNEVKISNRAADREDQITAHGRAQSVWEAEHVPRWLDATVKRISPALIGGGAYVAGKRAGKYGGEHKSSSRFPKVKVEERRDRTSNVDFYPGGTR